MDEPVADTEEQPTPVDKPADAPVVEEAPAEGEQKPEGEAPAEEKPAAAAAEIPEETLKAAAEKYANKTMAAARATAKETKVVREENTTLKAEVGVYKDFVGQLKADPLTALQRAGIGNGTVKSLLEFIQEKGEPKPAEPDEDNDFAAWRRKQKAREEQAAREAKVEEGKKAVFAAVDEKKSEYPRTATSYGKRELWSAIEAYHEKHGSVPDEAVWHLAGEIERALRADFGDPIPAGPAATKTGTPAAASAAPAARTGGNTMTNRSTASAPVSRKYSDDEDELNRQINAELRAEGLL